MATVVTTQDLINEWAKSGFPKSMNRQTRQLRNYVPHGNSIHAHTSNKIYHFRVHGWLLVNYMVEMALPFSVIDDFEGVSIYVFINGSWQTFQSRRRM